jgi:hypothetical protein
MAVFFIIIIIFIGWTALDKRFSKSWYDQRGSWGVSFVFWYLPQKGDYKSFHQAWRTSQLILVFIFLYFGLLDSLGIVIGGNQVIDFQSWKGSYTLSLVILAIGPLIAIFYYYETITTKKIPTRFIPKCLSKINDRTIQIFFLLIGTVPAIASLIYLIFYFEVTYN